MVGDAVRGDGRRRVGVGREVVGCGDEVIDYNNNHHLIYLN